MHISKKITAVAGLALVVGAPLATAAPALAAPLLPLSSLTPVSSSSATASSSSDVKIGPVTITSSTIENGTITVTGKAPTFAGKAIQLAAGKGMKDAGRVAADGTFTATLHDALHEGYVLIFGVRFTPTFFSQVGDAVYWYATPAADDATPAPGDGDESTPAPGDGDESTPAPGDGDEDASAPGDGAGAQDLVYDASLEYPAIYNIDGERGDALGESGPTIGSAKFFSLVKNFDHRHAVTVSSLSGGTLHIQEIRNIDGEQVVSGEDLVTRDLAPRERATLDISFPADTNNVSYTAWIEKDGKRGQESRFVAFES